MSPVASSKLTEASASEPTARERIWQVVYQIPAGCVASYGQVAGLAGLPNGARQVGRVMGKLPEDTTLPWHRVITSAGRIAFPPATAAFREQRQRLSEDGIPCPNGRVSMAKYGWRP